MNGDQGGAEYESLEVGKREELLLVGGLASQLHASVSQGRICLDKCTCCQTEIQVADQTFVSSSHSMLTPGRPDTSSNPIKQAPGRVSTGGPIFTSLV